MTETAFILKRELLLNENAPGYAGGSIKWRKNMGYYADGSGVISMNEWNEAIRESLLKAFEVGYPNTPNKNGLWEISIWNSDKYYEDEVLEALKSVQKITKEGYVTYFGEDREHWRFVFDPDTGTWNEEAGSVVYEGNITEAINKITGALLKPPVNGTVNDPAAIRSLVRNILEETVM